MPTRVEFNVSLNGRHVFTATTNRGRDIDHEQYVYNLLRSALPDEYRLRATLWDEAGRDVTDDLVEAYHERKPARIAQ